MGYDKSVFARNLVYYMKKNGESQINIAKYLNVSKSTVSAYCSGKQIPRIDKIELLAIHFGIEKSDLIEEKALVSSHPATPLQSSFQLTDHERELVIAYRRQPEVVQQSIDRILEIESVLSQNSKNA